MRWCWFFEVEVKVKVKVEDEVKVEDDTYNGCVAIAAFGLTRRFSF